MTAPISPPPEASITINGTPLTQAQSMTVRVAVTLMLDEMNAPGKPSDDIFRLYSERCEEILRMIIR